PQGPADRRQGTDRLVDRVVTADVLGCGEHGAVGRADGGGMEAAGPGEARLGSLQRRYPPTGHRWVEDRAGRWAATGHPHGVDRGRTAPSVRGGRRARAAPGPRVRLRTAGGVVASRVSRGPSSASSSWRAEASAPSTASTARFTTVIGTQRRAVSRSRPMWHHDDMRVHNFGAGPCALPVEVLEEVREEFPEYGETGMTVIEMSHRSAEYSVIHDEAKARVRRLSGAPDDFEILFLQGG